MPNGDGSPLVMRNGCPNTYRIMQEKINIYVNNHWWLIFLHHINGKISFLLPSHVGEVCSKEKSSANICCPYLFQSD